MPVSTRATTLPMTASSPGPELPVCTCSANRANQSAMTAQTEINAQRATAPGVQGNP